MIHMHKYVVIFESSEPPPPLEERLFEKKEDAAAYKAEHERGKFAVVMPLHGTFTA